MLMAPGRVVYPVADLQKAKAWYSDFLGAQPVLDSPFAVAFRIGEVSLVITPKADSAQRSESSGLVYWNVMNPEAALARLLEVGAKPHSELRTLNGLTFASVIDPFGNIIGIIGDQAPPEKRGVDQIPSESALSVAFLRALAALDEREEIRGKDTLAQCFLNEDRKRILKDEKTRKWVVSHAIPSGMYEYLMARTAYFDLVVQKALADRMPQIVFLGAGYDSRPYRFQSLNQGTSIFELDSPHTQRRKLELLEKNKIPVPEQVRHIPIDFKVDAFSEVLLRNGFNSDVRSLFIWEGVMYYLPMDAIDAVFDCVHTHSVKGSGIAFDYVSPKGSENSQISPVGASESQIHSAEPIRTRIESEKLPDFLNDRGFELTEHLNAAQMGKAFLTLLDGSIIGNVPLHFGLAFCQKIR